MKVNLGIIGCGAVTQRYHLPAAQLVPNVNISVVVDKDPSRAKCMSQKYNIPNYTDDYREIFDLVEGVIIALPHKLHAFVSIEFLSHGIPVLCEKPMATSTSEAKAMLNAAAKYQTPLAIGLFRRFYRASRMVKALLSMQLLGKIHRFDFEEGTIYRWPVKSGFIFDKRFSGGGVLIDTGSHTLDLLLWWLGDDILELEYRDDNLGGIEANCELDLVINYEGNEVIGRVELSRTRQLRNSYRIFGEKGWLEFFPYNPEDIELHISAGTEDRFIRFHTAPQNEPKGFLDYFADQLRDFARVIAEGKSPYVNGKEGYKGLRLIENCYKNRKDLSLPWITSNLNFDAASE